MNKMKEFAQLLGIELGEEFKLEGYEYEEFKLSYNDGLVCADYELDDSEKLLTKLLIGEIDIIKPILNKQEKEYLEYVIKPFRHNILHIIKLIDDFEKEFICIDFSNGDSMCFPRFEKAEMYKNMEINKLYTLEELGLL